MLKHFVRMRLYGDAQSFFFFVIAEAAPGSGILREDNRPLILVGNRMEAVSAGRQRLAFDRHITGKRDGGIFVRAGAPDFAVRNDFAPNLAPADRRPVIVNCDVCQPDTLRDDSALADARNVQLRWLAAVFELRFRARGDKAESRQSCTKAQNTLRHAAHCRTILSRLLRPGEPAAIRGGTPPFGGTASARFRKQQDGGMAADFRGCSRIQKEFRGNPPCATQTKRRHSSEGLTFLKRYGSSG